MPTITPVDNPLEEEDDEPDPPPPATMTVVCTAPSLPVMVAVVMAAVAAGPPATPVEAVLSGSTKAYVKVNVPYVDLSVEKVDSVVCNTAASDESHEKQADWIWSPTSEERGEGS